MITRKENLLVRPFQQRKYIEHRQKVITALPRIDDVSPPKRNHVYIKCKKLQTEAERHAQIERDNFILLKHLNDIMSVKRVDNDWLYEHPKFLRRVKLFRHSTKTSSDSRSTTIELPKNITKKEKCIACHPENFMKTEIIPEERVPWEMKPVREFYSAGLLKRQRQSFTPKEKYIFKPSIRLTSETKFTELNSKLKHQRSVTAPPIHTKSTKRNPSVIKQKSLKNETSLTVVIRFPPKTQVTLNAGISDKIV